MHQSRRQRLYISLCIAAALFIGAAVDYNQQQHAQLEKPPIVSQNTTTNQPVTSKTITALAALKQVPIRGRAPKTGYSRGQFGSGWLVSQGCDTRNRILARDLKKEVLFANNCEIKSGSLHDPYTGKNIQFIRGATTSREVQIDHVVALSDAWQKGAQLLSPLLREEFANDPLNLLAVDGETNQDKSDGDAATWLPPNKSFRCEYVSRQLAVKIRYSLWVSLAEHDAIQTILASCPSQKLPAI